MEDLMNKLLALGSDVYSWQTKYEWEAKEQMKILLEEFRQNEIDKYLQESNPSESNP